jgi:tetratricopeptide (TPR) repeat protein
MFADRPEEAARLFDQAKALDSSISFAVQGSVWARLASGQYEDALVHSDEAIRLFPDKYSSFEDRGDALAGLGRWQDAVESYERCIALEPSGYWEPWMKLARAQMKVGDADGARRTYEDLLGRYPGHTAARKMLEDL